MKSAEPIVLVTASDENYTRGVAVAIRSAIQSLEGREVRIFVLDGGITDSSKRRLLRSWQRPVEWLKPDLNLLKDLPISDHISVSTYLRLLLAEMAPVEKAIYLDADVVVVRNLAHLWETPLDGMFCAAAQDCYVPVLDPHGLFGPMLWSIRNKNPYPIPNYKELGLDAKAPYFNAGIMLVNVKRWRREQVAHRALQCLHDNAGSVCYWDQYALNVLFSGQWKKLDRRWNQQGSVLFNSTWEKSPMSEAEFYMLQHQPWIVHFDYKTKPWHVDCNHPYRKLFFQHLDRTAWRWWRPRRPIQEHADAVAAALAKVYPTFRQWRKTRVAPLIRGMKNKLRASLKAW
jgi:lipopolysaccharide biosynthesis glycosyltransferase